MNCTRKTAQRADAWNLVNRERERYTVPAVVQTMSGGCELRDKRLLKRLRERGQRWLKYPPMNGLINLGIHLVVRHAVHWN